MLLNSYGFSDVQNMTEAHVMSVFKVISGVKERVKKPVSNPNVNGNVETITTRHVSTRRRNKKPNQT